MVCTEHRPGTVENVRDRSHDAQLSMSQDQPTQCEEVVDVLAAVDIEDVRSLTAVYVMGCGE